MNLKAIIFDYGNTLIYEEKDWDTSEQKGAKMAFEQLQQFGIKVDCSQFVERLISTRKENRHKARETLVEISAIKTLGDVIHSFTDGRISRAQLAVIEDAFFRKELQQTKPLPDAEEVLCQLSFDGLKLGLISNATC